jgi:hypothetical protein
MPLVILHHLLNVFVQIANKRGFKQKKNDTFSFRDRVQTELGDQPSALPVPVPSSRGEADGRFEAAREFHVPAVLRPLFVCIDNFTFRLAISPRLSSVSLPRY